MRGFGIEIENGLIYYDGDEPFFEEYTGRYIVDHRLESNASDRPTNSDVKLDPRKKYPVVTIFDPAPCHGDFQKLSSTKLSRWMMTQPTIKKLIDRYEKRFGKERIRRVIDADIDSIEKLITQRQEMLKIVSRHDEIENVARKIQRLKNLAESIHELPYFLYSANFGLEPGFTRFRAPMIETKSMMFHNPTIADLLDEQAIVRDLIREMVICSPLGQHQLEEFKKRRKIKKKLRIDWAPFGSDRFCRYDTTYLHHPNLLYHIAYVHQIEPKYVDRHWDVDHLEQLEPAAEITPESLKKSGALTSLEYRKIKKLRTEYEKLMKRDLTDLIGLEALGSIHFNITLENSDREFREYATALATHGLVVRRKFAPRMLDGLSEFERRLWELYNEKFRIPTPRIRKTEFYVRHLNFALLIQWITPLILGNYGQPDTLSLDDEKVSQASLRQFYTQEVVFPMSSDLIRHGFEGNRPASYLGARSTYTDTEFWSLIETMFRHFRYPKFYNDRKYSPNRERSKNQFGADFRRARPDERFGFEFRVIDFVPFEQLGELVSLFLLLADHSMSLKKFPDPRTVDSFDFLFEVLRDGSGAEFGDSKYADRLEKAIGLTLDRSSLSAALNSLYRQLKKKYLKTGPNAKAFKLAARPIKSLTPLNELRLDELEERLA